MYVPDNFIYFLEIDICYMYSVLSDECGVWFIVTCLSCRRPPRLGLSCVCRFNTRRIDYQQPDRLFVFRCQPCPADQVEQSNTAEAAAFNPSL